MSSDDGIQVVIQEVLAVAYELHEHDAVAELGVASGDLAADDYAKIGKELRELGGRAKRGPAARKTGDPALKQQVAKLRRQLTEISAIDFFGATGRLTVEALLAEREMQLGLKFYF